PVRECGGARGGQDGGGRRSGGGARRRLRGRTPDQLRGHAVPHRHRAPRARGGGRPVTSPVRVGIVLGSDSDLETMMDTVKILESLDIGYEVVVASAHRTPRRTEEWASSAADRGLRVLIAAAGGAAALPGVVAAFSSLPVLAVPLAATPLNCLD